MAPGHGGHILTLEQGPITDEPTMTDDLLEAHADCLHVVGWWLTTTSP